MTQRTIVYLEDDLDGGDAEETVTFGLDGRVFEIDLSSTNAEGLRKLLAPYVVAGRRGSARSISSARVPRQRPAAASAAATDAGTIRQWALANGYEVNTRGRISAELRAAYEAS